MKTLMILSSLLLSIPALASIQTVTCKVSRYSAKTNQDIECGSFTLNEKHIEQTGVGVCPTFTAMNSRMADSKANVGLFTVGRALNGYDNGESVSLYYKDLLPAWFALRYTSADKNFPFIDFDCTAETSTN